METRTVDTTVVIHVAVGRVACAIASYLLQHMQNVIKIPINISIKQLYASHIFHSMARLDLPTFTDSSVQNQLNFAFHHRVMGNSLAWDTINGLTKLATMVTGRLSQLFVMSRVLRKQHDGPLLVILGLSQSAIRWYRTQRHPSLGLGSRSTIDAL
jgi:hypothetical protein